MSTAPRYLIGVMAAMALAACEININDVDRDLAFEVAEAFSYQVDATTQVQLRLENINGTVQIVGDPSASVALVRGERIVGSDSRSDAQRYLNRVTVDVDVQGDQIVVRTRQPNDSDGRRVVVDYDVIIPADMDVRVFNINGEVEVEDFDSDVDVENTNGIVRVLDIHGDVEVDLVNGNIIGDISPPPNCYVDFAVVNGGITLDLPFSVSAILEADVTNGGINLIGLSVVDATTTNRSLHGKLGGGNGLIDLQTVNGTITIRGR